MYTQTPTAIAPEQPVRHAFSHHRRPRVLVRCGTRLPAGTNCVQQCAVEPRTCVASGCVKSDHTARAILQGCRRAVSRGRHTARGWRHDESGRGGQAGLPLRIVDNEREDRCGCGLPGIGVGEGACLGACPFASWTTTRAARACRTSCASRRSGARAASRRVRRDRVRARGTRRDTARRTRVPARR